MIIFGNFTFICGNLTFLLPYEPSINRHTAYGFLVKKSGPLSCMFGLSSKKGLRRRFSSSEIAGRIFQDLGPDLRDGPEGCKGTRRLRLGSERWALNPEVSEEPGGSSLDPGIMTGAQRFFDRSGDRSWNLEEPGGSSLDLEIFDWNPEAIWEHRGSSSDFIHRTRNRMANRGFSLLIGGLHMGPEFLRKSLTGLEDAGVGVMTQVPGFAAFHVWRTRVLIDPWTLMRLRLHSGFRIGGLWRPDPARMPL
ncbi:hypothetical protein F2Q70_00011464 [Brassica cretica]|uniref:Uncharacterized protein n=1 Tax=Brassica cretica TaxID=69181 RepID=A0A8S9MAN4_BRACR|nr:hypothetical protein F2Q70_00011464 [Brassica cretica]